MRRFAVWLAAALVCLVAARAAPGIEVQLEYVKRSGERMDYPFGSTSLEGSTKPPAGEWVFSELMFNSERPYYALVKLGETWRLLVFDMPKAGPGEYTLAYFDFDADGDMTDETPIEAAPRPKGGVPDYFRPPITFRDIETTVKIGDKTFPYNFSMSVYVLSWGGRDGLYINIVSNCVYVGEFESGGERFKIAFGDDDGNGRFLDRPSRMQPSNNDYAYLDGDIMRLYGEGAPEIDETLPCGDLLQVKGALYRAEYNETEKRLTLTKPEGELFPLALSNAPSLLTLGSRDGRHCVACFLAPERLALPRGDYRPLGYALTRKDERGGRWSLTAIGAGDAPYVTVGAKDVAAMAVAEPFEGKVTIGPRERAKVERSSGPTPVRMEYALRGAGGAIVTGVYIQQGDPTNIPLDNPNGFRPKAPRFKVLTPEGEIVAQGSFDYG